MTYFETFRQSVLRQVAVGQLVQPVFARLVLVVDADHGRLLPTAAEGAVMVGDLLQSNLRSIFAVGTVESGHLSLQVELEQGKSALVSVALRHDELPRVDLLLIANHGTLYHESNDPTLEQEFPGRSEDSLLTWTAAGQELEKRLRMSLSRGEPVSVPRRTRL